MLTQCNEYKISHKAKIACRIGNEISIQWTSNWLLDIVIVLALSSGPSSNCFSLCLSFFLSLPLALSITFCVSFNTPCLPFYPFRSSHLSHFLQIYYSKEFQVWHASAVINVHKRAFCRFLAVKNVLCLFAGGSHVYSNFSIASMKKFNRFYTCRKNHWNQLNLSIFVHFPCIQSNKKI